MNRPNKCPFCNNPLCSSEGYRMNYVLECNKLLDHNITFGMYDEINVNLISINIAKPGDPLVSIVWNIIDKKLFINGIKIDYFEPDLSNFNNLANKVKTFMLLS